MKRSIRTAWLLFILAAVTFVTYSFALSGDFNIIDDQSSIVDNPYMRSMEHIDKIFTESFFGGRSYYRPLVVLSNMLNYQFRGPYPVIFHLTNVGLHILVGFSVFFFVHFFVKDRLLSFFSALLFAIHPIHWSAVANIAGRSIILCTLFYVNAFLFFAIFIRDKKKFFYFLSLLSFLFALLSKESAIVFPLVLVSYVLFFQKKAEGVWVIPFFGMAGLYWLLRRALGITYMVFWSSAQDLLLGILTFLRALGTYLRLFILPVDLHFDRSRMYFLHFGEWELLVTLCLVLFFIGGLFKIRDKLSARTWFFLLWFGLNLLTVSQIFPVVAHAGHATVAEHLMYLPSISIFVLLILAFYAVIQEAVHLKMVSKPVLYGAVGGGYLFFILFTIQYNIYSTDEAIMLKRTLVKNPKNVRIHNALGAISAREGRLKQAEKYFQEALKNDTLNVHSHIGLGRVLFAQGRYWKGIAEYEDVLATWGPSPLVNDHLDQAYDFLLRQYHARFTETPGHAEIAYSLGIIYSKKGEPRKAIEYYQKAVALDPRLKRAFFNLASSYAVLGEQRKAIEHYEKVLQVEAEEDHLDYQAALQLSDLYRWLGDFQKARKFAVQAEQMPLEFRDFKEKAVVRMSE